MRYVWIVAFILMGTMASAQQAADAVQPEAVTRRQMAAQSDVVAAALRAKAAGQPVLAQACMVAAAHPLAVQAETDILAAGGTAADALVAVQAVLRRVAPQSSDLGGGAFLVWYDVAQSSITTLDGRETAPLAATPGTPALLGEMHRRWGTQGWARLFDVAIHLAETGFGLSPRSGLLRRANRHLIMRCFWSDDDSLELPSTSHISIVESYGNVAVMTTTIENAFGD